MGLLPFHNHNKMENKNIICQKCKQDMGRFNYNWNGGLCSSCKFKRGLGFGILIFLIAFLISIPMIFINFNYDLDKCNNLNSKESNYDFDLKLETNAQYNNNCYFLHNHPLAFLSYFAIGILFSITFSMIGFVINEFVKPSGFKEIGYEWD